MQLPQPGIFAIGARAHHHLEFDLTGDAEQVIAAMTELREAATGIAGVNLVVGVGPELTAALFDDSAPTGFIPDPEIAGAEGFTYPADQHDIWLWLHGSATDGVFDMARVAQGALAGCANLASEQQSFVYRGSQDLTGFEDGTENPPLSEAQEVAIIPEGSVGAGGSFAILQKWIHDLEAFERLEVSEQEKVFGRTKVGSVELDDAVRPETSHVSRATIEDSNGEELQMFRRSTPFGNLSEHGLIFVGFAQDYQRIHTILRRMAGEEDGVRDQLTRFSTPKTTAWYFVPPVGAGL